VTLVVPDPRWEPVPPGWWDDAARPLIEAVDEWDRLDEYERLLHAAADLAIVVRADEFQFQAALRCVDARRGAMLGEPVRGRPPKSSARGGLPDDVSDGTANRWRSIAEHWTDTVLPHLRAASRAENPREASQRACLALLDGDHPAQLQRVVLRFSPWVAEQFTRWWASLDGASDDARARSLLNEHRRSGW
jgi:hypothetical protein